MAGLRKQFRRIKQSALKYSYRDNRCDSSFNWNWKQVRINRIAIINLVVSRYRDCAYLEIGCDGDEVFNSIPCNNKTGVDPNRGGTLRMTSDQFFLSNPDKFDVIYIDGLHTYEQVHKDVANAMRALKPGGRVLLHDLLPHNWVEAHVPRIAMGSWTGDVWKVAFELAQTAGVEFKIVKADNGVGIFGITGSNPILADLSEKLGEAQFSYLYGNVSQLPLVEWDEAREWILETWGLQGASIHAQHTAAG